MKLFAIFMAVLVLITGFNLCSTEEICNETEQVSLMNSHDGKQDPDRMCSPFCHCSSCPFSILLPWKMADRLVLTSIVNKINYQSASAPGPIGTSIWQPPKGVGYF